MRRDLPSGTVTFVFTDVEGSTKLLHELGAQRYAEALSEHRRIVRDAIAAREGVEVDTQGDAFFFAFPTAPGALEAAAEARAGLADTEISVRVGIHTGTPLLADEGYIGHDVHKAARIGAAGHGGQILVSSATAALVGSDGLSDLGEHRLKDLSAPERIYQLGAEQFPPLKTLHQTNLPIPATPFLGRERELQEVVELLAREDNRLLTLTGPGGSGKTRLALQSAGWAVERYPHGVFWVPLAPLRDPELVLESASQALGANDGLADFITNKRLLLLFDNFEHLLEAASGLSSVLSSCPHLDLLVTSREPLHVAGEQEYEVPPLVHEEAVGFFASRARAVDPGFRLEQAVAEICRRLDDLPLALELAAARVKALTPHQILERLEQRLPLLTGGTRDAPERQRTLRATIEWSYELLSPAEQELFPRLAVFRGGCTLEAVEEVAGADLDTLHSLVDKSLIRHRDGRYWMLETIREYAAERLEASGEADEIRRWHAEHFLALAEEAFPNLLGSPGDWLERLEAEHDNFRAALDHLEGSGDTQSTLQLAGALYRFWLMRGHLAEGSRRFERLLDVDARPTAARGRALHGAAAMASSAGDTARTRSRAEEALALHRELGDAWGVAYSLLMLGNAAADDGDHEAALALDEAAAGSFRELGDEHYSVAVLNTIAHLHGELGDLERERELHEEALRLARIHGNERMVARTLYSLSWHAVIEGRVPESIATVKEALTTYLRLGEVAEVAMGLRRLAWALAAQERARSAAQLLSRAEVLREEIGAYVEAWAADMDEKTLAKIRNQLDDEAFAEAWDQGRKLSIDEAVALALESAERNEARLVEP